jgi:hypothetical protein
MPSITYWNRLEPRARSSDLASALAARVRDPAWFLCRQWQLGEFRGEDAGTPAYADIHAAVTKFVGWRTAGQTSTYLAGDGQPIEPFATSEPFSDEDVSTAVDLGLWFERVLAHSDLEHLVSHWRTAFPVQDAVDDDPKTARLRALWKGRAIDGWALYLAATQPPQPPPAPPPGVPASVPESSWVEVSAALDAFRDLVGEADIFLGKLGATDPPSWRPERLDHSLNAYVATADGGGTLMTTLRGTPDADGDLEWFAFDQVDEAVPPDVPAPSTTVLEHQVIPGLVRFRGMPNQRFWDFEDGRVDFGGLRPDRRDLLSMVLMDFMLVQGNDWFLVPFEQPLGTRCWLNSLTVVDVFGIQSAVPRAEAVDTGAPDKRWSMFSTQTPAGVDASLLLPATVASSVIDGEAFEEVRFIRDETANLAWAIERDTESRIGHAWLGHERDTASSVATGIATSEAALRYRLQTRVPENWIPFQAVNVAATPEDPPEMALERARLLGDIGQVNPQARGKILNPPLPGGAPYRVREEEIPREGRRVSRLARWARTIDGKGLVWVSRRRRIGTGEGWSGLRYDLALPATAPQPATPLVWDAPTGWDDKDWAEVP